MDGDRHIFYKGFFFAPVQDVNTITVNITHDGCPNQSAKYTYVDGQMEKKVTTFPHDVEKEMEDAYIRCINAIFHLARLH